MAFKWKQGVLWTCTRKAVLYKYQYSSRKNARMKGLVSAVKNTPMKNVYASLYQHISVCSEGTKGAGRADLKVASYFWYVNYWLLNDTNRINPITQKAQSKKEWIAT